MLKSVVDDKRQQLKNLKHLLTSPSTPSSLWSWHLPELDRDGKARQLDGMFEPRAGTGTALARCEGKTDGIARR